MTNKCVTWRGVTQTSRLSKLNWAVFNYWGQWKSFCTRLSSRARDTRTTKAEVSVKMSVIVTQDILPYLLDTEDVKRRRVLNWSPPASEKDQVVREECETQMPGRPAQVVIDWKTKAWLVSHLQQHRGYRGRTVLFHSEIVEGALAFLRIEI